LSTIKAPDGLYSVLSLSPDGKTLAAGTKEPSNIGMPMEQDCLIRVWNRATGKQLRQFQAGRGYTNDLFFSHDGGTLVARTGQLLFGGRPAGIYVWDLASGKLKRRFVQGEKSFHGIAVSPDGRQLLTGYFGDLVRLWDIDTGKALRQFGEREMHVYTAAFSPDGKLVLGVNVGIECIHVWSAATGEELERFSGHRGSINSIAVSPDGKFLASTGDDTSVLIWDLSRANKRTNSATR
jgi:WD40 repeat protein